jgi:malonyl CoA-acyl carrier protein transacylase
MVEDGVSTFIEVCPGQVLTGLIKRIEADVQVLKGEDLVRANGES